LLTTINNIQNGINNYVDGTTLTTDTNYYIKIYDDKGYVQSETISFNFVYKAYYGKIISGTTINDVLIQSLNNTKLESNFDFTISLNDELIIIASHDILSSIVDSEYYDMIDSFTLSNINLNINNTLIPYNVYISNNTILDNNVSLHIEK
jgi:hypothetical protein